MPFKIPRLDSNASSQTFIPETATFSSQNDSQFYIGSSQQSRDSAYGASQPDKIELASFWNSLRGVREPEVKSVDSAVSSAVFNQKRLLDEIEGTINDIDAVLAKELCPDECKKTAVSENVETIRSSLDSYLRSLDSMMAFDSKVKEFSRNASTKLEDIQKSVSEIKSISPHGSPILCPQTSFSEMKMKCFASNLNFLVNMAKEKLLITLKHRLRENKPFPYTSKSLGCGSLFQSALGTPIPSEEPVDKISNSRQMSVSRGLLSRAYGSCITRKTPVFAVNLLHQEGRLNNTICANELGRSARKSNIRRAHTSSEAPHREQKPVFGSTTVRRCEPCVTRDDGASLQAVLADGSEGNSMDSFFRPMSADSSDSEDCISLSDFILNEE